MAAAGFALTLVLAGLGCAGGSEGSCSWLFAPASFVDAGQPGCKAEPAGQICDPDTGRCESVCQANEYLLTCRTIDTSSFAIPEETLANSSSTPDQAHPCSPVQIPVGDARTQIVYCCQCAR